MAATAAKSGPFEVGLIGAGTGATMAKWSRPETPVPGGLVTATLAVDELRVSALVVVNAVGTIDDGTSSADPGPPAAPYGGGDVRENTTIGIVATNAKLDKIECHLVAQSAHDGLARALLPAHTAGDGDAFVACATGRVDADLSHVRVLAQQAVVRAVRSLMA